MKIKKIKLIKKYKSFLDFQWEQLCKDKSGQVCSFTPFSIIFGENSSGKSAACEIIKDLTSCQEFEEYKPDEAELDLEVIQTTSNTAPSGRVFKGRRKSTKTYKFDGDTWNESPPEKNAVLFFDVDFINKNIHSHGTISKQQGEHTQNAGKLIINLDEKANELKRELSERKRALKDFEYRNEETLSLTFSEDDGSLYRQHRKKTKKQKTSLLKKTALEIDKKRKEEEKLSGLLAKTSQIGAIQTISLISYSPQISDKEKFKEVFTRDIKKASETKADESIKEHYLKHKRFLEKDENYKRITETSDKACPLCMQPLSGATKVIEYYKKIFDKTYEKEKGRFISDIQTLNGELTNYQDYVGGLTNTAATVFNNLEKIAQDFNIKNVYSYADRQAYTSEIEKVCELPKEFPKLTKALDNLRSLDKEQFQVDYHYNKVSKHHKKIEKTVAKLNKFIKDKNSTITKFKGKYSSKGKINTELSKRGEELNKLDILQAFLKEDRISKMTRYKKVVTEKDALTKTAKDSEEALKKHLAEKIPKSVVGAMLKTLDRFNLNFSLQHDKPSPKTKEYSFSFKVVDKDKNEREFKKGLAEGERQIISLSFFFALNDNASNKKNKILIFDDPITSLDAPNLKILSDVIHQKTKDFGQVIVLTHHPLFFKYLAKQEDPNPSKFGVAKNREEFGGSFIFSDPGFNLTSEVKECYQEINDQAKKGTLNLEVIALKYGQLLRLAVERFIKNELLMWNRDKDFTEITDNLIQSKNKIRKLTDSDIERVKNIYKYCSYSNLLHVDKEIPSAISELDNHIAEFIKITEKVN